MNNEMDRYSQTLSHRNRFPDDWKLKPFWSITKKKSETNNEGLDLLSVYLNQGVVRFDDVNEKRTNVTSEDTSKYQKVERGNLVLNNQQAWRGSVGVSRFEGIVSPAYIVLELSEELETGYSNYLFRDQYMVDNYAMSSKGVGSIQRNIFFPILRTTPVPIPPFQEQKLISRYLDKKTSQIDSLVEKIQKKIELLKEQRTSLINHYVTKGLDPNVEMKDSGVEWMGEIPKHWEVTPMLCLFIENKVKNKDGRLDVLTLSYGKIKFRDLSKLEGLVPETFDGYQVMEPQSIIIRSTDLQNDHKSLRIGHVGVDGVITSAYLGLNPIKDVDTKFYYYSIHLADLKKVLYGLGGGLRQSLRFDDFKRFPILNPPQQERDEI